MSHTSILKTSLCSLLFWGVALCSVAQTGSENGKTVETIKTLETLNTKKPDVFYYNTYTGLDILPGPETTSIRFRVVKEHRFNPKFSVGLGTGFTFYHDPLSLVPLLLNAKYRQAEGNVTPFVSLSVGYNISILSDTDTDIDGHSGGYLLNPAIGLQFATKSRVGWHISAGFNIDRSNFSREGFDGRIVETDITYRRFMLGMGLAF